MILYGSWWDFWMFNGCSSPQINCQRRLLSQPVGKDLGSRRISQCHRGAVKPRWNQRWFGFESPAGFVHKWRSTPFAILGKVIANHRVVPHETNPELKAPTRYIAPFVVEYHWIPLGSWIPPLCWKMCWTPASGIRIDHDPQTANMRQHILFLGPWFMVNSNIYIYVYIYVYIIYLVYIYVYMYISTHQHIRTHFQSVRPFQFQLRDVEDRWRSNISSRKVPDTAGESFGFEGFAAQKRWSEPWEDPTKIRKKKKRKKNPGKKLWTSCWTSCFYMFLHVFTWLYAQRWWVAVLFGVFVDAEWFRMSSGFSQKCLGFDSFWMYLGPRATDVPPSILATASTAGFAGLISDRSWWNWFEHVRFQWVSSHPVSILKLCAFGASSSCAARTSWWVFLWEIATMEYSELQMLVEPSQVFPTGSTQSPKRMIFNQRDYQFSVVQWWLPHAFGVCKIIMSIWSQHNITIENHMVRLSAEVENHIRLPHSSR